ncbi:MAG: PTS sugar transporter subunit IIA [Phycisphaerales bacterium]|nr:PTS sugar transporter subunit IIA [Phycisphaerales bacterium]
MQLFIEALKRKQCILDLEASDIRSIIQKVVDRIGAQGTIPTERLEDITAALIAREESMSTAIGHSVAIPHAYLDGLADPVFVFVRLAKAANLGAPDGIPTRFLFFLLGPPDAASQHLDALANIARVASDHEFRFDAGKAKNEQDLLDALGRFTARTSPPTRPEAVEDDALAYSGRLFGGVAADLRRRLPHYLSDYRDGLHTKCAGSILFLFFACLAPAITFGGVMAAQTGGHIGAVEMLVASAICGVIYAIFAGQPLIILGGTGPLLVFTAVLYRLCNDLSIPFLPTYAWVGIWSAVMIVILAATDASCLMRYFTRFTDEIFAALISIIFIVEAIKSLIQIFRNLDVDQHHDTALLSLLLALGTYQIAMGLSRMRRSRFLLPSIREFLADFGPTIALAGMTLVAFWLHEVHLDILSAPDEFGTTSGRPWMVSLFDAPMWVRFAALGPAVFVTVLVYLDQNITARLINSRDHKLRKGATYHLDLIVVGVLMGACSLFGLPWLVAATVRSLNHLRSLATIEEATDISGSQRERLLHVRETRITGLAIHILIGLSLLLLSILKTIPMATLYGLFLFMGVVSMSGNQFLERLRLWFMDSALYPTTHYIRNVPFWTIHKYTFLQLMCLVALWVVKASSWAIMFPIFIAVLAPVRILANRFFEPKHLAAMDAEEEPEEEETHWT